MAEKRHCLICGEPIYSGTYCVDCLTEIRRVRTADDESFEEWLQHKRSLRSASITNLDGCKTLDSFF